MENRIPGFRVSPGVLGLLGSAGKHDEGYKYTVKGDLGQMSAQGDFLRRRGFDVGQLDVYPALKTEEEYNWAVLSIYLSKIEGWWHYRKPLIEAGICTEEEFNASLDRYIETHKRR